jgi:hypothetical protein
MARNSVVERTWVKDSQHFPAELRDFRVVVEANSHQMHDSVASLDQGLVVPRSGGLLRWVRRWALRGAAFNTVMGGCHRTGKSGQDSNPR